MTVATPQRARISPDRVHDTLRKHLLIDGFDFVLDLEKSRGSRLFDAKTKRTYVDFFSFFASNPIGLNHPGMADPVFREKLLRVALSKVTNSDIYTVEMAEFVETFDRVGIPAELPHAFFVEGGTLGVENAIKAAFDWKIRKNKAAGHSGEIGTRVLHFEQAFHGRGGYTLSLTNTFDPNKTKLFPKFEWPRVLNPRIRFPLEGDNLRQTIADEQKAAEQIHKAFEKYPADIAAILIEPIQAEGGDNHFRAEFLQELRRLADQYDAMLIFDEVQTGVGLTGKFWAYQHFGVTPDMLVFAKKMQVGGFLCGRRIEEIPDNVFAVPSRINSTWGGNLTDMVRATRFLEIIEENRLVENAARQGDFLLSRLQQLQAQFPDVVSNARGRGLMCALDFPTTEKRNQVRKKSFEKGMIILACGERSLRFRPVLDVTKEDLDNGLAILTEAVREIR